MPIITVNSNQLISTAKYNEIQTAIAGVLSYYGVVPGSLQITGANTLIYASNAWAPLWTDINKCAIHQTGASIPGTSVPTNTTTATVFLTNQMIDATNSAVTNKNTAAAGQLSTFSSPSIRTSNFGSTGAIHHTVEYEWVDAAAMTSFLQTGGRLEADLAWSNAGTALDSDLIDILGLTYTDLRTETYKVSVTNQTPSNATHNKGVHTITVTFTRTTTKKYTLDISILSTSVQVLNGSSITGTTRCYTSTNSGTPVGGISGPVPSATITNTFEGSATPPTPTKALRASSLSTYSFYTGDTQSTSQTITLTNDGNSLVHITGIAYTHAGGVVEHPTYSWTGNGTFAATTVNAGGTRTIALTYSGVNAGTHNNSITVVNDSDQSSLTIPTTQVITGFDLSPNPSSLTPTLASLTPYTQQFIIVHSNVSPILSSSYTASVSGTGFVVINSASGPTLVFDPSGKNNGTFVGTISVTLGGYTVSKTVTLTLNVPTQNLGSWISAKANDNAVVGISYDIIGGTRYITFGVGTGNDGSAIGGAAASAVNLRYDADPDPSKGVPLYDYYLGDRAWVTFLKGNAETSGVGYGVCYRYHTTMPVTASFVKRSYTFTAQAGAHSFGYAVDDNGYVEISNPNTSGFDVVFDARGRGRSNYNQVNQGSWTAPVTGTYTINLYSQNTGYPGAVAFQLYNQSTGLEVWSTRVPVRVAYTNWAEVYRIPLNQGATTYYSKNYIVKDSAITGYDGKPYGDFFEGQSIFSVQDRNGDGNLTITFNPVGGTLPSSSSDQNTIYNITKLPYYHSDYNRISNLTEPSAVAAGYTNFFTGFNATGGVTTTILAYPSDPILAIPATPVDNTYYG